MFKKVILISAILASSASFAMNHPAPYVGASLGVIANTSSIKGSGSNAVGNYRGVPFNVFAGYGGVINQGLYLAGEMAATLGTGDLQDHGMKTSYGYSASVIPGVMLSERTLAFVRAGLVRAHFSKQNTNSTGGEIGVGMQTSLTQNLDVRGEYDYVGYRSINGTVSGANYTVSPRSDQFNLGLIYKFD